mgnify:CR=1 FL=1
MSKLKGERAGSEIQRELSMILLEDARDEDFKRVTITACEVSNDLSYAKVYYTVLDITKMDATKEALEKASPFIKPAPLPDG